MTKINGLKALLLCGMLGCFMTIAAPALAKDVNGFRSARFGQSESEVLSIASKDLSVSKESFMRKTDEMLKVTVLSTKLKSFDPIGLPATISYVFGYKCNCLVQVSVVWEFPKNDNEDLRKSAMRGVAALVGKFLEDKWSEKEVVVNRLPKEAKVGDESTIIFFRGQNEKGGAITLAGAPVKMEKNEKAAKGAKDAMVANVDTIKGLSLIYEKDATAPDIFKVDVSGF